MLKAAFGITSNLPNALPTTANWGMFEIKLET